MFDDTAKNLCDRIYLIDDVYGASSRLLLSTLRGQALANGYDIITCYCPLAPFEKIEHIFVPELRVGFMTANDYHQPDIERQRQIKQRHRAAHGKHSRLYCIAQFDRAAENRAGVHKILRDQVNIPLFA